MGGSFTMPSPAARQQIPVVSPPARNRVAPALVAALALAALAALTACGGGGGGEEKPAATAPAGGSLTQAPTAGRPTPTPKGRTTAAAASPRAAVKLCTLVTADEADEALGEFVTGVLDLANKYCQYDTKSGIYLRIEPGSQGDFQAGAELQGVGGEPVPSIGEESVWFAGALGVLSVRQGDAYFRMVLNLPEVDSSNQLKIARGLATKAAARIP
ncbi:MAG: hypothetical protein Q7T33_13930 [Dehalococcoidia bacterium]|nr:hypothetical protein [Dehalococcoidia bacterium]